jgi:tetratricopeptide (TPR) repeat protein
VLQALGRFDEAVSSYDHAVELNPDLAETLNNRGNALQELNRWDEAIVSYEQAIKLNPNFAQAHNNCGLALQALKHLDQAVARFERAIELMPDYAEAHNNCGLALQELTRLEDAVEHFDRAIEYKPNYAEAFNNRGVVFHELKRIEDALASYDRAIALNPEYADAYSNRGLALHELRRVEEAVASFDRDIQLKPDYAEAYSSRGISLQELKRLDDAMASYDKAIALKPDYAEAHNNRGNALQELKRFAEAIASYDRAIELKPDFADAHMNKSLAYLITGELNLGWPLYEWRWKKSDLAQSRRDYPQPLWLGEEDISGKTILLHAEQGLGDTIQFCRYARLVKERGARVVMGVPQALVGLLGSLEGVDELVVKGESLPAFDFHCPLLSLPLAFKTDLIHIPSPSPYLEVNASKISAWAQKLGEKKQPRIGLVWSGSLVHKNDHNRSLTLKQLWDHLPQGFEYFCLQKELREVDQEVLISSGIHHHGNDLHDFTDTAALCQSMDLVISVDTSVAHLSAAIGKTTWVLLPYAPDWRWLLNRTDSPWYQCMTLYRQDETRAWTSVLGRLATDLRAMLG